MTKAERLLNHTEKEAEEAAKKMIDKGLNQ